MKIDHVQLSMPPGREPAAREYFVGILGMKEEDKPEPYASRSGCWFSKGEAIVRMGVESDFAPQKQAHPAFVFEDLSDLAERLIEKGYPVGWDESLSDRKHFYTCDPFGNRIEFLRDGDGFTQK